MLFMDNETSGELPVSSIDAIDTTGAGDILHGAFCFRFAQGDANFTDCLRFAAKLATLSCTHIGTRSWMSLVRDCLSVAPNAGTHGRFECPNS